MGRDRQDIKVEKQQTLAEIIFKVLVRAIVVISIWISMAIAIAKNSHARDFGVVGHSYNIIEQDIIEYIKEKLFHKDLEVLNKEMQEKVKVRISRPEPVAGITDARENREYYYDPTFILGEDIRDHKGQLIHAKGTEINPLSKVPLGKVLIFINADNEKQVEYAFTEYKAHNEKAKIILTSGSPAKLQKEHNDVWIYFDQFGALTKKLGIKAVPAIVKQEGMKLKISEVALK